MDDNNKTVEQVKEIKSVLKKSKQEQNVRMFQRYLIILLYLKGGMNADEISDKSGVSRKTVYNYISAYNKGGINGLNPVRNKGANTKLSNGQIDELKGIIINKYPSDCGFPVDYNWTADLLRKYVETKYGVKYSRSGMTALLKRIGFSYTRATYVLAKADPLRQEEFMKEFEEIYKKTPLW